jgi:NDP-sugar pyrophosphorylase family protein
MWPEAQTVPKTLLPVAGRPFADWQLGWLADAGVTSVVYCIGFLGGQVAAHVGDGSRWGLEVQYVDEGERLRGTGGAIRLALDSDVLADRFLVLYGDSWLQVDPAAPYRAAERADAPALMTVYENSGQFDASNVVFAGDRVLRYEKGLDPPPPEMRWIDYGLSVLTRSIVAERVPPGTVHDLAALFTGLSARGELAGYLVDRRFYEIGSPTGLAEVTHLLTGRR